MDRSEYSRVLGSLYGMATGDALGVPSSFMTPQYIQAKWGWIDTFYPPEKGHIFHDGLKAGEYTDDTEQAIGLLNSFYHDKRVVPQNVVKEILAWAERVKDKYASPLGPSTERALLAIKNGADINESGKRGNTNGAAMRIAPLGLIHGLRGSSIDELVDDVVLTCIPTHNTSICISAASAIAWSVALAVRGESSIEAIVNGAISASEKGAIHGYSIVGPSIAKRIGFCYEIVKKSSSPKEAMHELYEYFGGGDLAGDSIPVSIALFSLGEGKVKEVNEYCVNFGGDCDTNAAMAGAIAGAYSGVETIPKEWIDTIEKVNGINMPDYARKLIEIIPFWNK